MRWGGQLTIDQILTRPEHLKILRATGCEYLFLGLETLNPQAIGGMSKDVGHQKGSWIQRAETALQLVKASRMSCGVAVLFGLGEGQADRLALLERLRIWRLQYGCPEPVSLNWAVQHPLLGEDGGTGYQYLEWSTPMGRPLDLLRHFGEASMSYPLAGSEPPSLTDVAALLAAADMLESQPPGPTREGLDIIEDLKGTSHHAH